MIRNTQKTWGAPARLLHWAMAGVILFLLGLGFWMSWIVTDLLEQFRLVQIHKSWGFVAFSLGIIRILWRLINPTPSLPDQMPAHERLLAHAGHFALYALIIIMPVSGWLMSSASTLQDSFGVKNMVFGQFEMYDPFVPGSASLAEIFAQVHFLSALMLVVILVGHAGAALMHHVVKKDDILMRMTFGKLK